MISEVDQNGEYGRFFIVAWVDSIIEKIRFSGMVKREFIRFIFIPSQVSSFCGCQTDFSELSKATLS